MNRWSCPIVILAVACLMNTSVWAGGDAGRETPFTSIGAGARSIGMGGGLIAMSSNATAVHYNPSGLADLDYQEFAFMHSVLFEGSTYDFAGWAYPINENHGFGGGIMRVGTDDIIRREDFADRGQFNYAYTQLMLAYGRNFSERLTVGIGLKIVHQSLDNYSDFGVGFDAGINLRLYRSLYLGAIGRDLIQPELKLVTYSEKTPRGASLGLALRDLAVSDPTRLAVNAAIEKDDSRDAQLHAGAELSFHQRFAVRLGYDRDEIAFGAGLTQGRLKVDYAYKVVEHVQDLHHFSVTFLVGKSTGQRIEERALALLPPEPTEEEKRFAAIIAEADRFFHRFQLDSARVYFLAALDMQPGNQEIIGTLAAIEETRRIQRAQQEELRTARDDVAQTLNSFVAQAERLLSLRLYDAALDLLDLIFDIDPAHAVANALKDRINMSREADLYDSFETARVAADSGQWVEAMEAYNRVIDIDPDNNAARIAKQQLLLRMDLPERIAFAVRIFEQGALEEARARFEAILEVNPNEPQALEYLRRIDNPPVVEPAGPPATTLEDLQADRVHWDLYLEGLRQMRNKEYQLAIDAWEKVLEAYPRDASTLENIRQARLRMGTEDSSN